MSEQNTPQTSLEDQIASTIEKGQILLANEARLAELLAEQKTAEAETAAQVQAEADEKTKVEAAKLAEVQEQPLAEPAVKTERLPIEELIPDEAKRLALIEAIQYLNSATLESDPAEVAYKVRFIAENLPQEAKILISVNPNLQSLLGTREMKDIINLRGVVVSKKHQFFKDAKTVLYLKTPDQLAYTSKKYFFNPPDRDAFFIAGRIPWYGFGYPFKTKQAQEAVEEAAAAAEAPAGEVTETPAQPAEITVPEPAAEKITPLAEPPAEEPKVTIPEVADEQPPVSEPEVTAAEATKQPEAEAETPKEEALDLKKYIDEEIAKVLEKNKADLEEFKEHLQDEYANALTILSEAFGIKLEGEITADELSSKIKQGLSSQIEAKIAEKTNERLNQLGQGVAAQQQSQNELQIYLSSEDFKSYIKNIVEEKILQAVDQLRGEQNSRLTDLRAEIQVQQEQTQNRLSQWAQKAKWYRMAMAAGALWILSSSVGFWLSQRGQNKKIEELSRKVGTVQKAGFKIPKPEEGLKTTPQVGFGKKAPVPQMKISGPTITEQTLITPQGSVSTSIIGAQAPEVEIGPQAEKIADIANQTIVLKSGSSVWKEIASFFGKVGVKPNWTNPKNGVTQKDVLTDYVKDKVVAANPSVNFRKLHAGASFKLSNLLGQRDIAELQRIAQTQNVGEYISGIKTVRSAEKAKDQVKVKTSKSEAKDTASFRQSSVKPPKPTVEFAKGNRGVYNETVRPNIAYGYAKAPDTPKNYFEWISRPVQNAASVIAKPFQGLSLPTQKYSLSTPTQSDHQGMALPKQSTDQNILSLPTQGIIPAGLLIYMSAPFETRRKKKWWEA